LQSLLLWKRSSFGDHILEVAVGTELQYHDDVVLREKTVEYSGGEEAVLVDSFRELLEY